LRRYWPAFQYELQDLTTLSDEDVRGEVLLQVTLLLMKYIQDPVLGERLEKIFVRFQRLTVGEATLEFVSTMLY